MKFKIVIISLFAIITIVFIYNEMYDTRYDIVSLGDKDSLNNNFLNVFNYNYNNYLKDYLIKNNKFNSFNNNFSNNDITVKELINDILNNKEYNNQRIQSILYKADIINIFIGMEELKNKSFRKKLSDYDINKYCNQMNDLFNIIKTYRNKYVFIIGIYKTQHIDDYVVNKINSYLKEITYNYNFIFICINEVHDNKHYFDLETNDLNFLAHELIYKKILYHLQ